MRTFDNNELRKRVDEVLYYIWDPIGVSDQPFACAEYEDYVSGVLQLVNDNDDPAPVSAHLADIVDINMALISNRQRGDAVAALLLQHKNAIKEGCA